jgi:O-antigen ligase
MVDSGGISLVGHALVARLYGVWLSLNLLIPSFVPGGTELHIIVFVITGCIVAVFHSVILGPFSRLPTWSAVYFCLFIFTIFTSLLLNADQMRAARDILTIFPIIPVLVIGLLVSTVTSRDFMPALLESFAIAGSFNIVLYMWWYSGIPPDFSVRLSGHFNPNAFGLLCSAIACASLAVRAQAVRASCLGLALLGLYMANSRSNILGLLIGFGLIFLITLLRERRRIVWRRLAGVACVSAVALLAAGPQGLSDFVLNDLFAMDDPHRGVMSGFTGRSENWSYGLERVRESPVFGYGYRGDERVFAGLRTSPEADHQFSSSHNGYLSILIDLGFVGFTVYIFFVMAAVFRIFTDLSLMPKRQWAPSLAFIAAYLTAAMFERYALNAGNAASVLFILVCFHLVERPYCAGMARMPTVSQPQRVRFG